MQRFAKIITPISKLDGLDYYHYIRGGKICCWYALDFRLPTKISLLSKGYILAKIFGYKAFMHI